MNRVPLRIEPFSTYLERRRKGPIFPVIVAGETAARASADIARSLEFTPVVAATEDEAVSLLDQHHFSLIAVAGAPMSRRLRDAAQTKQPSARVLELPEANGDDTAGLPSCRSP